MAERYEQNQLLSVCVDPKAWLSNLLVFYCSCLTCRVGLLQIQQMFVDKLDFQDLHTLITSFGFVRTGEATSEEVKDL